MQELGGHIKGDCSKFQAAPGYGLKCRVGGVEKYAKAGSQLLESMSMHMYSSTEVNRAVTRNDIVGEGKVKKLYHVRKQVPLLES